MPKRVCQETSKLFLALHTFCLVSLVSVLLGSVNIRMPMEMRKANCIVAFFSSGVNCLYHKQNIVDK